MDSSEIQLRVDARQSFLETCFRFSVPVLVIYDHILTLDPELRYVWTQRRSLGTALFFIIRYLGLVYMLFIFAASAIFVRPGAYETNELHNLCSYMIRTVDLMPGIIALLAQIVLQLRIYALYDRKKVIRWILTASILLEAGPVLFGWATSPDRTIHPTTGLSSTLHEFNCNSAPASPKFFAFGLPIVAMDLVVFTFALFIFLKKRGDLGKRSILMRIVQGSALYFVSMFSVSIVSIVLWSVLLYNSSSNVVASLYQPSMILTTAVSCICISRIFLDLRHEFDIDSTEDCEDVYTMSWRVERIMEEGPALTRLSASNALEL